MSSALERMVRLSLFSPRQRLKDKTKAPGQGGKRGHRGSKQQEALGILKSHIRQNLSSYSARSLSRALLCLSQLGCSDVELLAAVEASLIDRLCDFSPEGLASLLSAFSRNDGDANCRCQNLCRLAESRVVGEGLCLEPHTLALLDQAFVDLGHYSPVLHEHLDSQASPSLPPLPSPPRRLTSTFPPHPLLPVPSFSPFTPFVLASHPPDRFLSTSALPSCVVHSPASAASVSFNPWTPYPVSFFPVPPPLSPSIQPPDHCLLPQVGTNIERHLAWAASSCGSPRVPPPPRALIRALVVQLRKEEQLRQDKGVVEGKGLSMLSPSGVVDAAEVCWRCSDMGRSEELEELLGPLASASERAAELCSPGELAELSWAMLQLGSPASPNLLRALEGKCLACSGAAAGSLSPKELTCMVQALSHPLSRSLHSEAVALLCQEAVRRGLESFSPRQIAHLARACSSAGGQPYQLLCMAAAAGAREPGSFPLRSLAMVARALADSRHPSPAFFESFEKEVQLPNPQAPLFLPRSIPA